MSITKRMTAGGLAAAILAATVGGAIAQQSGGACTGVREPAQRTRIVNGLAAKKEHWPGFAALRVTRQTEGEPDRHFYFCGGTVIGREWVVTAAHCFDKIPDWRVSVVIEADDLARASPSQVREVSEIIVNPAYRHPITGGEDLALVRLATPWDGARMRLAPAGDDPNSVVMVAGFGYQNVLEPRAFKDAQGREFWAGSDRLHEVTLPVVERNLCRSRWQGLQPVVGDQQICAGYEQGDQDSCTSDSGGPLVSFDKLGCPYQVGVVSWGEKQCGRVKRAYGVYSRVAGYLDWLRSHNIPDLALVDPKDIEPPRSTLSEMEIAATLADLKGLADPTAVDLRVQFEVPGGTGGARVPGLRVGDTVRLRAASSVAGRLVLVFINPELEVRQFYPNRYAVDAKNGAIAAGDQLVTLEPGWFEVVAPVGSGRIVALLLPPEFPTDLIVSAETMTQDLRPTLSQATYLSNLANQVGAFVRAEMAQGRRPKWGLTTFNYTVASR